MCHECSYLKKSTECPVQFKFQINENVSSKYALNIRLRQNYLLLVKFTFNQHPSPILPGGPPWTLYERQAL